MRFQFWKKSLQPKTKPEHRTVEAFEVDGVKYFKFDCEVGNMPYQRGLEALVFYEQVRMRCTREHLEAHCKAVDAVLKSSKIDIFKLHQLNQNLSDRLTWVIETDSLYNLASVVFFDATESPYHYDFDYNKKKIAKWKKHQDQTRDFFLQMPLSDLIPSLKQSEENLHTYSKVVEELKMEQMRAIQEVLFTKK